MKTINFGLTSENLSDCHIQCQYQQVSLLNCMYEADEYFLAGHLNRCCHLFSN